MDDKTKASYAYDPFQKEGQDRWGRKGASKIPAPNIPNYDVIDFLGEGGMASVWSAKYKPLNQARALKIVSEAMALDTTFVERFLEEAKALARLEHPNIVKIYDVSTDFARPYIAMDYVAGKTLNDVLKARNLSQDEALRYFANIADALDYAHGIGFIHRDIKPSNVIIANTGKAMLIDFGVASWLGGVGERANSLIGTIRYMSPEACRGERVTTASDLWAFAVLIYRTLTGTMPFDGKSEQEIMGAIMHSAPKEPKHPNARVRAYLKQILDKDPEKRPKSAGAMVNELNRIMRPFMLKTHKEGLAVGASMIMAGVVVVALVASVAGYFAMRKPTGKGAEKVAHNIRSLVQHAAGAGSGPEGSEGSDDKVGDVGGIVAAQDLSGIWYASFGSQWAEIKLDPTTGNKFHAVIETRDSGGLQVVEADGEMLAQSKIRYHETGVDDNPSGKPTTLAKFSGEVGSDHTHVTGKLSSSDGGGGEGSWVRLADMPMTPYQNSQIGFSVVVPMGWETNVGDSTVISPTGRPDVVFSVTAMPLNGAQAPADIFKPIEDELASATAKGGSYMSSGSNSNASFGGKQGSSWDVTHQLPGGPKRHGLYFCTVRGEYGIVVQSWWPINEDAVWAPVLEAMQKKFLFSD